MKEEQKAPAAILVADYSDYAIIVRGDTKPISKQLKELGGRWNPHLKGGAAWVFKKSREQEIRSALGL